MTRDQWIGAGVVFLLALAFLVAAVLAWHTDPEDVVRKTEARREAEQVARFAFVVDNEPTEIIVREPAIYTDRKPMRLRPVHSHEATVPVAIREDER